MTKGIIVAAFNDRNEALEAVDELEQAGIPQDQIGFALRGSDVVRGGMITDATGAKDAQGAIKGAATGSLIGGVLGAAAAATIPGIGPVLAAGVLTAALGGAGAGAAIGGIFGALSGLGASEEEAMFFQREFESGKAIVSVQPGESGQRCEEVVNILTRHGGYRAHARD